MGKGYWVLVWDGWGSGLNMINPRLLTDEKGNNWWSCPAELEGEQVEEHAIKGRKLPWLDRRAPADWGQADSKLNARRAWQGSAFGSTDYNNWMVVTK